MQDRPSHDQTFGRSYPGRASSRSRRWPAPVPRGGGIVIALMGALAGLGLSGVALLAGAGLWGSIALYIVSAPFGALAAGFFQLWRRGLLTPDGMGAQGSFRPESARSPV